MPIYVQVKVNDDLIHNLAIGRMTKCGSQPDSINEYAVVIKDGIPTNDEWDEGTLFLHRYGDGVDMCVQRALAAIAPTNPVEREVILEAEIERLKDKIVELEASNKWMLRKVRTCLDEHATK
jgi:hypothetical protein